ncbi:hypothetical protein EV359DRAFT_13857, partial [Lentinula novae-zelandiae]
TPLTPNPAPLRSPAPEPSPTRAAEAVRLTRLRTPAKPTTPVVPSPLRQAWGQSSKVEGADDVLSHSLPKSISPKSTHPTQTATYMSTLIKEVTPVRNLDVRNPYQAASPVGAAVGRSGARKPGASESVRERDVFLEKYSAQAVIEATLPKGSKRSRAPVNL